MLGIDCLHWAFSISSLVSESAPPMSCQVWGGLCLHWVLQAGVAHGSHGRGSSWSSIPVSHFGLPTALPVLVVTAKVCRKCNGGCQKNSIKKNLQTFKQVQRRLKEECPSNNKVCSWELGMRKPAKSPRAISGFWKVSVVLLSCQNLTFSFRNFLHCWSDRPLQH